jgi:probable HAF family extracellular repeat protein
MSRCHACLVKVLIGFGCNRAKCLLSAAAVLVCAGAAADPQACYEITRVDTDPPETQLISGLGLNDAGVVVGAARPFEQHAFAWRDGSYTDLHAQIDPSGVASVALAINNHGEILGNFSDVQADQNAFLLRGGEIALIQPFGSTLNVSDSPRSINNLGQVAGAIGNRGYIWDDGDVTELPALPQSPSPAGAVQIGGINDLGVVVGTSGLFATSQRAVMWKDGQVVSLGQFDGFPLTVASAINNRGQIVALGPGPGTSSRQVIWEDGAVTPLPVLEGGSSAVLVDINNSGQVVGWTAFNNTFPNATTIATLWTEDHVPFALKTLICADDPLRALVNLQFSAAINDRGQILATGPLATNFPERATYLLTPRPSERVPPTAVIVSEDFEPMQAQWQTIVGAWTIVDGTYATNAIVCPCQSHATITSYPGLRATDPPTQTLEFDRYTFRVRMRNTGSGATTMVGVLYQWQGGSDHYAVDVSAAGVVSLRRNVGGIGEYIATASPGIQPNAWFDLEVQRNQGKTTVKIDGITVFKDIVQTELTSGQVGLHGAGTRGDFDNVSVSVPFGDQPFREHFTDGIAQGWTPLTGQWAIANGTYNNAAVQPTNITLAPIHTDRGRTDSFTLRARMLNPYGASGNLVGIAFNYVDSGGRVEYDEVVFSPTGTAKINRVMNRVVQTLATAPYNGRPRTWFDVKFEVDFATTVTVDGVKLFDRVATNPHPFPQGGVGLITHWAPGKFDDVWFDHEVFEPLSERFETGVPPSATVVGSWSADGGTVGNDSVSSTALLAFGCCLGTNTIYRARLRNDFGGSGNLVGLIYSYQDADSGLNAGDYYEVVFSATGSVMLRKFIQGVMYTVATGRHSIPPNVGFNVEVIRRGILTSVRVNGTAVISNIAQAQLGPGRVGPITHWSKGRFDDFSVTERIVR